MCLYNPENMQQSLKFFYTLILLLVFNLVALCQQTKVLPFAKVEANGRIYDFVVENTVLYAATDAGTVESYDINTRKLLKKITLPHIIDFVGDKVPPKLFSIDKFPGKDKLLVVSQGTGGNRDVYLIQNNTPELVISSSQHKMLIKRAGFIDAETIYLALISNEIISYHIPSKKTNYRLSISESSLSAINHNTARNRFVSCDEGGKLYEIDLKKGKIIKTLEGVNLDNVYYVAVSDACIISAGQDRKVGVYTAVRRKLQADFPVYCCGINTTGTMGAYASNEQNDVNIFSIDNLSILATLVGNKGSLTHIFFVSDKFIITSSEDKQILFFKIP